jgi:hypothetical protein
MKYTSWTDTDIKRLKQMCKLNTDINFIETVLRKPKSQIFKRMGAMGFKNGLIENYRKPYTEAEDTLIVKMYQEGNTYSSIGKFFGRSGPAIKSRIKAVLVTSEPKPKKYPSNPDKIWKELLGDEMYNGPDREHNIPHVRYVGQHAFT